MTAAGRRPQGQDSGARRLPAPAPEPRGARGSNGPATQQTQVTGEKREAGQEAVTGREQSGAEAETAPLQTPPSSRGTAQQGGQLFP